MEQPGEIFFLIFIIIGGVAFNSLFGFAASKIFESKGRSKGVGFWLGFFGGIVGIIIAAVLPAVYSLSAQPIRQVNNLVQTNDQDRHGYLDNHSNNHRGELDELDDAEWRQKIKEQDRKFDEEYEEKKRVEEEKVDAYWEAQDQKKREEEEYWEDKRQEERDRLQQKWDDD